MGTSSAIPLFRTGCTRKFASILFATAALAIAATPAADARERVPHREKPAFPQLHLDRHARGDEAINALGNHLPAVADWYGMDAPSFRALLRADRHARLDRNGRLHFVDELTVPEESANAVSGSLNSSGALLPLDQTFLLHSRPGAKRVIFLDFRGGTLTGTTWNQDYGVSTISAVAFDLDGNPGAFNNTELGRIQYIWQRVAEDYAPFDIDVTTEPPAASAITRSSISDDVYGTRVLITKDFTASTSSPCNCGGIAYVGVFDNVGDYYKPALVFYNQLGPGNEKYVAEAISHEAGHNLGLLHDGFNNGTTSTGYYSGHGSGATGWAPIMGVSYYRELTQWSKGEYPYATQTQDDLVVMQSNGGLLRADDHGDTPATATPFDVVEAGSSVSISGSGVIGTRDDVDFFSVHAGAGAVSINVSPVARGANLDIQASLYDAFGNQLALSNPTDALNASIAATLPAAGTYYLKIDGVGKGDLATGYSDFASLGNYFISGTAANPSINQPPSAVASGSPVSGDVPLVVNFSGSNSSDPDGDTLSYDWDFGDGSAHSADANPSHTYTAAGNFVATLTVTDTHGASASAQVGIATGITLPGMHVSAMSISFTTNNVSGVKATARMTIVKNDGKAAYGATVTGVWSGAVTGSSSSFVYSTGAASATSPQTKVRGVITYTVTDIVLDGYRYDSASDVAHSISITY
ncbi:MAG: PKD domain-containing protein [Rhodocyclaceae bacterium]|nr:PKD domain-containing protein [Rhodocyclaceae bacterium]MBX3667486.1 PKD domain-containing protein [Rhodocyclaceae bacterium]